MNDGIQSMSGAAAKALLVELAGRMHIGPGAATKSVLLTNADNLVRRSLCLSLIEDYHAETKTDDEGQSFDDSPLNWGDDPQRYMETYESVVAVSDGMYADKCRAVLNLCEALRAVLAIAGESDEVRSIVEKAIAENE